VEKIRDEEEDGDGDEVRVDELAIDVAAALDDESLCVAVGTYNI